MLCFDVVSSFARKPPMLVIVALANKNARVAWALLAKGGIYRAPQRAPVGSGYWRSGHIDAGVIHRPVEAHCRMVRVPDVRLTPL